MSNTESPVQFVVESPNVKSGGGKRESKASRMSRVSALFTALFPLAFLTAFAGKMAQALVDGHTITLPDGTALSKANIAALKCPACSGFHGNSKDGQIDVKLLPKNAIWRSASGKIVSISQSCIEDYLLPVAKAHGLVKSLTGLDVFVKWYPGSALSKEYIKVTRKTA